MTRLPADARWCLKSHEEIHHTGRTSGRLRATPVVTERVTDGFITPLPYGTDVDWLRNVLAAGQAAITVGGRTFDVANPRIIDWPAPLDS